MPFLLESDKRQDVGGAEQPKSPAGERGQGPGENGGKRLSRPVHSTEDGTASLFQEKKETRGFLVGAERGPTAKRSLADFQELRNPGFCLSGLLRRHLTPSHSAALSKPPHPACTQPHPQSVEAAVLSTEVCTEESWPLPVGSGGTRAQQPGCGPPSDTRQGLTPQGGGEFNSTADLGTWQEWEASAEPRDEGRL